MSQKSMDILEVLLDASVSPIDKKKAEMDLMQKHRICNPGSEESLNWEMKIIQAIPDSFRGLQHALSSDTWKCSDINKQYTKLQELESKAKEEEFNREARIKI